MKIIKNSPKSIQIEGNIKGLSDLQQIKSEVESYNLSQGDAFTIEIIDSFSMPSAMIGYLLRIIEQDKIKLTLVIYDKRLTELLADLNLKEVFNIKSKSAAFI